MGKLYCYRWCLYIYSGGGGPMNASPYALEFRKQRQNLARPGGVYQTTCFTVVAGLLFRELHFSNALRPWCRAAASHTIDVKLFHKVVESLKRLRRQGKLLLDSMMSNFIFIFLVWKQRCYLNVKLKLPYSKTILNLGTFTFLES